MIQTRFDRVSLIWNSCSVVCSEAMGCGIIEVRFSLRICVSAGKGFDNGRGQVFSELLSFNLVFTCLILYTYSAFIYPLYCTFAIIIPQSGQEQSPSNRVLTLLSSSTVLLEHLSGVLSDFAHRFPCRQPHQSGPLCHLLDPGSFHPFSCY